jgi:hypothetical protein
MKLGAAAHDAWRSSALVKLTLPEAPSKGEREKRVDFTFVLDRAALNKVPPRGPIPVALELGRYRSGEAVEFYLQLSDGRELVFTRYAPRAGSTRMGPTRSAASCRTGRRALPGTTIRRRIEQDIYDSGH